MADKSHISRHRIKFKSRDTQMTTSDMLIDLVDENDIVTGPERLSVIHQERMTNHRTVNIVLSNSRSQVLLLRRRPSEPSRPDSVDVTLSSVVFAAETYDETLARIMLGALDLQLGYLDYDVLGLLTPHEHGTLSFLKCFHVHLDITPAHNPDHFQEAMWLDHDDLFLELELSQPANRDIFTLLHMYFEGRK